MLVIYEFGWLLIDTFSKVGEWLMTPVASFPPFNNFGSLEELLEWGQLIGWNDVVINLMSFVWELFNRTPAELIIGSSLVGILSFKLTKFFLDIIF